MGSGALDLSVTRFSGMVAVTERVDRLGMVTLLDAAIGPIKARDRGLSGGQLLGGMAAAQLAGSTRRRQDAPDLPRRPVEKPCGARRSMTPGRCKGKAHQPEHWASPAAASSCRGGGPTRLSTYRYVVRPPE